MNALPPLPDKSALIARVRMARAKWGNSPRPEEIETVDAGEESVWDYPRPPLVRPATERLRVEYEGSVVADTQNAIWVCETAGAPVAYFPPADVRTEWLSATDHVTICEWKGAAVHYDLTVDGRRIEHGAYSYPDPIDDLDRGFSQIAGWFAFYPARLKCFVGDERARPQPGGYYGGWVIDRIRGPIKGDPGTGGW